MELKILTDKINELARKNKTVGLTDEEKKEREVLRREYIDRFKNNMRSQLEEIKPMDKK
ncbi:DUF896 domain-containing protein [uncultured Clostridium sp.]|uniref:DUF896 domain-containing protein n=1 Tax=uncultured Clostridium sp. TaxID=59620 RepID=UPI00262C1628|nr:DUF896 domain-containing protein [uncultured Clostridium sp.]